MPSFTRRASPLARRLRGDGNRAGQKVGPAPSSTMRHHALPRARIRLRVAGREGAPPEARCRSPRRRVYRDDTGGARLPCRIIYASHLGFSRRSTPLAPHCGVVAPRHSPCYDSSRCLALKRERPAPKRKTQVRRVWTRLAGLMQSRSRRRGEPAPAATRPPRYSPPTKPERARPAAGGAGCRRRSR